MDNKHQNSTEAEIIEKLKSLQLQEVPPDLTNQVMARISTSRTPLLRSIWNYISQTQTISFRPAYAFSLLLLVCSAFFIGRFSQPVPQQIATIPPVTSQLQPAMIEIPQSAYPVGRGLLQADGSHEQALAFLKRASMLEPDNPSFAYWEGVGHWANGNQEQERQSYLRGLESDPAHIPLLINLGHSYLGEKKYHEALNAYQTVLTSRSDEPVALYNSGLIYRALGIDADEISSWQSYLQNIRQGTKAFRAVKRLNVYGDYTFRSYRIGEQKVIVNQQRLLDESEPAESQIAELADIAAALDENESLNLEIIVFIENDREAARELALKMKKMISALINADVKKRLRLSWFDVPETIQTVDADQSVLLSQGLLLFTHTTTETEKEASI